MGSIMRHEDWPEKLAKYLSGPHKFNMKRHNCALFVGNWVKEATGLDRTKKYKRLSKAEMIRLYEERGGWQGEMESFAEIHPKKAQRGDVALMNIETLDGCDTAPGIVMDGRVAVLGERGIVFYPIERAIMAWRV